MELKNKIALVTGGADGLGFAIVKELAKHCSQVNVLTRNIDSHKENLTLLDSSKCCAYACDVTNSDTLEEIAQKIGKVDILINNAGIWLEGSVLENDWNAISQTIDTNIKGVIYTTKAFLKYMIENDSGFILNISSTSGLNPKQNESVYDASKSAVTTFTQAIKQDLIGTNIKVAAFHPGGMNTKFFEKGGFPKNNNDWLSPEIVAQVITTILSTDDSAVLDHVVMNRQK